MIAVTALRVQEMPPALPLPVLVAVAGTDAAGFSDTSLGTATAVPRQSRAMAIAEHAVLVVLENRSAQRCGVPGVERSGLTAMNNTRFNRCQLPVFTAPDQLPSRQLEYHVAAAQYSRSVGDYQDRSVAAERVEHFGDLTFG